MDGRYTSGSFLGTPHATTVTTLHLSFPFLTYLNTPLVLAHAMSLAYGCLHTVVRGCRECMRVRTISLQATFSWPRHKRTTTVRIVGAPLPLSGKQHASEGTEGGVCWVATQGWGEGGRKKLNPKDEVPLWLRRHLAQHISTNKAFAKCRFKTKIAGLFVLLSRE